MKAILLAAGKGERLKSITSFTPKPMICYEGKPILQYNIEMCKSFGIQDIYINVHHHADQITSFFGNGQQFDVQIHYCFEKELLGTSGAVRKIAQECWDWQNLNDHQKSSSADLQSKEPFFVIYGDQFSKFNLKLLIAKYKEYQPIGVIAFHHRDEVVHSGVAEFNENDRILRFIEKPQPEETSSHWVNAGIYYLDPHILKHIPVGFSDFGRQIFPALLEKNVPLYGVCEHQEVKVFDTPEMYQKSFAGEHETRE